jgi:putative nucleotidyltransferase with HDIG domain
MSIPEKILDGIDRLEPLPITVQKLIVALNSQRVDFNEIAKTIEYDGAITSNILRTANSAAFAGRTRIETARDAVVRLGTVTLLDLVLIGYLKSIKFSAPMYDLTEDDLWLHGATASLAVKAIAKESRNRKIPEASNIAALIHDIGKLIMVRYLKVESAAILKVCEEKNLTFVEAEKELFGCNHAEVGGAMARNWSFPEPITLAIERHHEAAPAEPDLMLDAVVLANLTAKTVGVGLGAAGMNYRSDIAGAKLRIGLTPEGFERVCAQTATWVQDLKHSYGFRTE